MLQQILAPDINASAVRVLALNGIEVVIPQQGCCGQLRGILDKEKRPPNLQVN